MRRQSRFAWAVALLLACGVAWGQRVEGDRAAAQGPYEVEIPVNGQGPAERDAGFARGLSQVLSRLTGERNVAAQPGVGQALRRASEFVAGYDYRQDEGLSVTGAPSFTTTLIARFEQDQVEALAATLGLPVWPHPRPKPVLWLAIDDGRGPRLVALPQHNAARPITQRAIERGYKLGLPAGSAAEQAAVGAIWRGDAAAIVRLSSRYSPPMQLIGKLYRAETGGWTADWTFVDGGKVLSTWSATQPDARRAIASGADGAADALSRKYARRSPAGPAGNYRVVIAGIDGVDDFLRVSAYLQGLPVVRRITPVRASDAGLELELELLSGLPGLQRMVASGDVLAVAATDDIAGAAPVLWVRR